MALLSLMRLSLRTRQKCCLSAWLPVEAQKPKRYLLVRILPIVGCQAFSLDLGPVHMEVGDLDQAGEVPRLGGVTSLSMQSLFFS